MDNIKSKKILKKLLSINSENPPGNESKLGEYIFEILELYNYSPKKIFVDGERFNIFLEGDSNLLIVNHMDTVPIGDENKWKYSPYGEEVEDKIYGRGACDNKGNLAILLSTLIFIEEKFNDKKSIPHILLTIGEEVDFAGVKDFVKNFQKYNDNNSLIRYALVLEPTEAKICSYSKGILKFQIISDGKAAHSSKPELGINAIHKSVKIINKFIEYEKSLHKISHPVLGNPTINIGEIKGGNKFNIVPNKCSIIGERRILPNENTNLILSEIFDIANGSKTEIEFIFKPVETQPNSVIISKIKNIYDELKLDKKLYPFSGVSELAFLFHEMNIEGVVLGFGNLGCAHTSYEHIEINQLELGEKIMKKIFLDYIKNEDKK